MLQQTNNLRRPLAKQVVSEKTIQRVLTEEAGAILNFAKNVNTCRAAVELIFSSQGPLVVVGIGKSGHIAKKIASTFRSLGKAAVFLHAAEASHGDLGLVQKGSVVLILSNSGETTELSDLIHYCRSHKIPLIGLTGGENSTLAKASDIAIVYGELKEACHNGLAPTTSTTLSLAIGDALAVAVAELLGTAPEDFLKFHPGGKLSTRLSTVGDIMRTGHALPIVLPTASMSEVVVTISEKALGIAVLVKDGMIEGIITDGDLRRNVNRLWAVSPMDIATRKPVLIHKNWLVSDAVEMMSLKGITVCPVEDDEGRLIGILHIHDCVRSGAAG